MRIQAAPAKLGTRSTTFRDDGFRPARQHPRHADQVRHGAGWSSGGGIYAEVGGAVSVARMERRAIRGPNFRIRKRLRNISKKACYKDRSYCSGTSLCGISASQPSYSPPTLIIIAVMNRRIAAINSFDGTSLCSAKINQLTPSAPRRLSV